jgi:hypothetical protein
MLTVLTQIPSGVIEPTSEGVRVVRLELAIYLGAGLLPPCSSHTMMACWSDRQNKREVRNALHAQAHTIRLAPSPELEQLKALSLGFATVQQRVDQLAASQQQMSTEVANLRADQQELLQKMSAPPPRQTAIPARKPGPLPAAEAR